MSLTGKILLGWKGAGACIVPCLRCSSWMMNMTDEAYMMLALLVLDQPNMYMV